MQINKTMLVSFIVGVFCAGFAYQVYVNYEFQKLFVQDHNTLSQIVSLINNNAAQSQGAAKK